MTDWIIIRSIVEEILNYVRYTSSGKYKGEPYFLTPYQIAVLVNRANSNLKESLPIGGENVGPDSLSQQIA